MDWGVGGSVLYGRDQYHRPQVAKLYKSCGNPLTDGLHKEGSSVTKRKGKVLGHSDIKVAKVWVRPSTDMTGTIPPIQMAREDIKLCPTSPKMSVRRQKHASTHSSSQKSEKVEIASYVEVSSMSDRLTEIMEEPEEEEE